MKPFEGKFSEYAKDDHLVKTNNESSRLVQFTDDVWKHLKTHVYPAQLLIDIALPKNLILEYLGYHYFHRLNGKVSLRYGNASALNIRNHQSVQTPFKVAVSPFLNEVKSRHSYMDASTIHPVNVDPKHDRTPSHFTTEKNEK